MEISTTGEKIKVEGGTGKGKKRGKGKKGIRSEQKSKKRGSAGFRKGEWEGLRFPGNFQKENQPEENNLYRPHRKKEGGSKGQGGTGNNRLGQTVGPQEIKRTQLNSHSKIRNNGSSSG